MPKQSWERPLGELVGDIVGRNEEWRLRHQLHQVDRPKEAQQPVMRDRALDVVRLREVAPVSGLRLTDHGRPKRRAINRAG